MARSIKTLATYEIHIRHRPGKLHRNADALGRIPRSSVRMRPVLPNRFPLKPKFVLYTKKKKLKVARPFKK